MRITIGDNATFVKISKRKLPIANVQKSAIPETGNPKVDAIASACFIKKT